MKLASRKLVSLLTGSDYNDFFMADLYRILLVSGQEILLVSGDVSIRQNYRDVIIGDHPIAYYPLSKVPDVDDWATDELPGGINLSVVGTIQHSATSPISDGDYSSETSIDFDGNFKLSPNTSFTLGQEQKFRVLRAFSYECWFYANSAPSGALDNLLLRNTNGFFQLWWDTDPLSDGGFHFSVADTLAATHKVIGNIAKATSGVWHHIVCTWDGYTLSLYLDGELCQSVSGIEEHLLDTDPTFELGGSGSLRAVGRMAHVAVYPYPLSQTTILRHYAARTGIVFSVKSSIPVERSVISEKTGLEVSSLQMIMYPTLEDTISSLGISYMAAAKGHYLENATVDLYRAFSPPNPAWPAPEGETPSPVIFDISQVGTHGPILPMTGTLKRFSGFVNTVESSPGRLELEVKSVLALLEAPTPRNLYRAGCGWELYGTGCGVARESHVRTKRITFSSTQTVLYPSTQFVGFPSRADFFTLGYIEIGDGFMRGLRRPIKSSDAGRVTLASPLPSKPEHGTLVYFYPGCDKRLETCGSKFNNSANFRGFPLTPPNDSMVAIV
jgi:hypothetical protein